MKNMGWEDGDAWWLDGVERQAQEVERELAGWTKALWATPAVDVVM